MEERLLSANRMINMFQTLGLGQRLANEMGCPFLEVSASEDVDMVTDAFLILSREVVDFKRRSRTFFDRVFGAFGREKVST